MQIKEPSRKFTILVVLLLICDLVLSEGLTHRWKEKSGSRKYSESPPREGYCESVGGCFDIKTGEAIYLPSTQEIRARDERKQKQLESAVAGQQTVLLAEILVCKITPTTCAVEKLPKSIKFVLDNGGQEALSKAIGKPYHVQKYNGRYFNRVFHYYKFGEITVQIVWDTSPSGSDFIDSVNLYELGQRKDP